jgi:hypothetical protein
VGDLRWSRVILGLLMLIAGGIWFLQGIGLIGGSFMTGSVLWAIIGALVLIAGILLVREGFGRGRP